MVFFLPNKSSAASIWDETTGITISSDTEVTTAVDAQSEDITINSGITLMLDNGTLNKDSSLGSSPLTFENNGTISVGGDSKLEDRSGGRAVIKGGVFAWGEGASLIANRLTIRQGTDLILGANAGSLTTSGLSIDSSRINIPLVALQASDAPINLGYTGSGYTSDGNGVLGLNSHQSGTVDLGTITINGLVTDATKAKIGVGDEKNVYLATGIGSVTQGQSGDVVTDLSAIKLTTNDVLFSMSGLTFSGTDLFVAVSRLGAQAAMPGLPQELNGLVDGYSPGTNTFMDSAVTKGASAAQAVTSAAYTASAGGGVAAVATNSQNVAAIAARSSGQAMAPGSTVAVLDAAPSVQSGLSAGDSTTDTQWKQGLGIWASPVYAHDRGFGISVGSFDTGYNANTYGVVFGVDYTFGDFRTGLAGNVGSGYVESTGDLAKTKNHLNYGGISLYGSWNLAPVTLSASGGWTRTHNSLDQDNVAGKLSADYDADLWSANLLAEYTLRAGDVSIIPSVGFSYGFYNQHKFDTEMQGSTIASTGRAQLNIVNLPVGLRANMDFAAGSGVLTPELRARWIPSVADTHLKYDVRMPGSSGVASANSPMLDNQNGEIGAGLKYSIGDFSVSANYDYQFSEHHASHGVNALLRLEF